MRVRSHPVHARVQVHVHELVHNHSEACDRFARRLCASSLPHHSKETQAERCQAVRVTLTGGLEAAIATKQNANSAAEMKRRFVGSRRPAERASPDPWWYKASCNLQFHFGA